VLRLGTLSFIKTLIPMNMTKFLSIFLLLLSTIALQKPFAQTPLAEAVRKADIEPAWPGCDPKMPECTRSRLNDFIAANLQMPLEAKKESAGGVVAMEFVIEKNGLIGEVHPMHDPGYGLADEATRVINLLNTKKIKWTPAEDDGKKIAFRYIIPVTFNVAAPPRPKAQVKTADAPADGIYDIVEVMPKYQGCENAGADSVDCTFRKMIGHIKSNLKYPEEALKMKVQGQVIVEFIIDKEGNVTQPSIKQGLGAGCDEEAIRVVSAMPKWTPGMQGGQPVPVRMKVPFFFQLPKQKEQ
ncbi:MAG TPA: energy transducer TonB, partial [Saprospiraceae bacterium]|nr:energy transducer TonB [Saprospiraceae bacterium]